MHRSLLANFLRCLDRKKTDKQADFIRIIKATKLRRGIIDWNTKHICETRLFKDRTGMHTRVADRIDGIRKSKGTDDGN